ncbi:outer membrane beta-barrel protein [Chryseolinea lacunae]|uniref:PorT family protein n=1 Tax=Chryseolinea lacunae TaxID=2801331 RepID=A0ABS1KZD7_9BACT|nr:outer membrane beta-barrel protein [Chryseolinea lacunae]MBL0744820.1 PorT family protein [Chryseolinea lacunae]
MLFRGTLFTILFTTIFLTGYSQNLELEVLAGPSLSSVRGSKTMDMFFGKSRLSFSTGVGLNVRVLKQSYLLTGLLYERKGTYGENELRDGQNNSTDLIKTRMNYSYITLPVQWAVRVGQKVRYQFGAGVYASYLLKQTYVQEAEGDFSPKVTAEQNDLTKKIDVGVVGSVAAYIPLKEKLSLKVGIDEHFGLINTSEPATAEPLKHQSLALTVGLNVTLK